MPVYDVAIVGGGPAGLMAALKSALLFHTAVLIDKGPRTSRAFFVPKMDNIPGYPTGASGKQIMDDLRAQIQHAEKVENGDPNPGLFVIGDLRAETWKQIPIALGDAESAVIHAFATRL